MGLCVLNGALKCYLFKVMTARTGPNHSVILRSNWKPAKVDSLKLSTFLLTYG